jgi:hypothetical protein
MNRNLGAAKSAKQDEFYTQYVDIQKEVEAYLEFYPDTFRGKVVYCNCDDPFESNFFKYFAANFNKLGLKKLVTTSYDGSPIAGQGVGSTPKHMVRLDNASISSTWEWRKASSSVSRCYLRHLHLHLRVRPRPPRVFPPIALIPQTWANQCLSLYG